MHIYTYHTHIIHNSLTCTLFLNCQPILKECLVKRINECNKFN